MKVGCCFNSAYGRRDGTANLSLRALKEMEDIEVVYIPSPCTEEVPKCDAYIYVDDGIDAIRWIPPKPNAFWAVDTHLGYGYRLWKSKKFDHVFVAQREAVAQMRSDGVSAEWLPLACHPKAHISKQQLMEVVPIDGADTSGPGLHLGTSMTAEQLETKWDIAFVGFLHEGNGDGSNNRVDYLDTLYKAFPNSWLSVNVFFEEMSMRFIKAKLGFNISIKKDLNMRVFEVLSTGTALLTNRNVDGIDEFFIDGEDYFGYEGKEEMVEVAHYALSHNKIRKQVAESGFRKVRMSHTYQHRMERILEVMNAAN